MDNKKLIGQRINVALARKNIKQKELAEKLSVSDNTISYFVSGKRTPNTEQIIKISQILDISTDYLLGRSEILSPDTNIQAIGECIGLSESVIEALKGIKTSVATKKETIFPKNYFDILNALLDSAKFQLVIMAIDKYAKSVKDSEKEIEAEKRFIKEQGDKAYKDLDTDILNALDSFSEKQVTEIEKQQVQLWRIQQHFIGLVKTIADKIK